MLTGMYSYFMITKVFVWSLLLSSDFLIMFGSRIARLPRPFIRQSAVPNSINQNLRPKISNCAYHNSVTNSGVQNTMNHSFYFVPDTSA